VTAIGYAAPILVVDLRRHVPRRAGPRFSACRWWRSGLAGVLVVLSPRLASRSRPLRTPRETLGAVVVLLAAVCAALAQVFVRKMVQTESTSAIVFYFSLTASGAVAPDAALGLGLAAGLTTLRAAGPGGSPRRAWARSC
jgi:hypothetical protein